MRTGTGRQVGSGCGDVVNDAAAGNESGLSCRALLIRWQPQIFATLTSTSTRTTLVACCAPESKLEKSQRKAKQTRERNASA